jgi:hypothetical protein
MKKLSPLCVKVHINVGSALKVLQDSFWTRRNKKMCRVPHRVFLSKTIVAEYYFI